MMGYPPALREGAVSVLLGEEGSTHVRGVVFVLLGEEGGA